MINHLSEPPIEVPPIARTYRPDAQVVNMGAPRRDDNTPVADVGTANMLVHPAQHPELGHMFTAYYRPTPEQLIALFKGGVIEIAQWGAGVQPFSLAVLTEGE